MFAEFPWNSINFCDVWKKNYKSRPLSSGSGHNEHDLNLLHKNMRYSYQHLLGHLLVFFFIFRFGSSAHVSFLYSTTSLRHISHMKIVTYARTAHVRNYSMNTIFHIKKVTHWDKKISNHTCRGINIECDECLWERAHPVFNEHYLNIIKKVRVRHGMRRRGDGGSMVMITLYKIK